MQNEMDPSQSPKCNGSEKLCYEGRGYCNEVSLQCECSPAYAQSSELIQISYCSVHVVTARTVNGLSAIVWGLSFMGALLGMRVMRRKERKDERWEVKLLIFVALFSGMYCIAVAIVATSEPYGARTLGNDIGVTILYCLAMVTGWTFVVVKPLIGRSGLSASVFTYLTKGRVLYARVSPFMLIATWGSSLSPLLLLTPNSDQQAIVSGIYLLDGIVSVLLSLFVVFAILNLRANIRAALTTTSHDLAIDQRRRLAQFSQRSTKVMGLFLLSILASASGYAVIGADYEIARRYTWIIHPVVFLMTAVWTLRHVVNNIRLSWMFKAKRLQVSKMDGDGAVLPDGNGNGDQPEEQQPISVHSAAISHPTRSVSPFASRGKHRKLKRIKRKPLEPMTAVTERTAEGTVYFTHVEGLESMAEEAETAGRLETALEVTGSEEHSHQLL